MSNDCSVYSSWQDKVALLNAEFLKHPQTECPVTHLFQDGKYIREMRIPHSTLFIGRVHKRGHDVQLLEGELILMHPTGRFHKKAPDAMRTFPGYQTVFYTLTDVVGRTVHPDRGERDLDVLEADLFEPVDALVERAQRVLA